MKFKILLKKVCGVLGALCLMNFPGPVGAQRYISSAWCPDKGDGTYVNPVLHADYSDPDVCAVGGDYYLTASSFGCAPGLPVLHSRDLVNWRIIGYALKELVPTDFYARACHGKGVWAPAIRYHNGEFYIYWGDPDFGIYMVKSTDPAGEWSRPVLVKAGKGLIDPCPLWEGDNCYLVFAWAASRAHINSVLCVEPMNAEGTRTLGHPRLVFDGNADDNFTAEGPKFYKRNGYYYILCPAGGVEMGWQLALRSKNVYGPYEARRVMEQGKTLVNGPHQGGWIHTECGEDWFLHFQDKGCYGRVVHLQPMHWKEDWPVIGEDRDGDGCGNPVVRHAKPRTKQPVPMENPVESDEFDTPEIGMQWEWHSNYHDLYGFPTPYGYMRLYTHKLSPEYVNLWEAPNLFLQKFPAEEFTAETKLKMVSKEDRQQGGLIVMGWDYCMLTVQREGDTFVLKQTVCQDAEQGGEERIDTLAVWAPTERQRIRYSPTVSLELFMRLNVRKGGECTFAYSRDGRTYTSCGRPFRARQGKWIGAKMGFVSVEPHTEPALNRGWLDIDWFRVGPLKRD